MAWNISWRIASLNELKTQTSNGWKKWVALEGTTSNKIFSESQSLTTSSVQYEVKPSNTNSTGRTTSGAIEMLHPRYKQVFVHETFWGRWYCGTYNGRAFTQRTADGFPRNYEWRRKNVAIGTSTYHDVQIEIGSYSLCPHLADPFIATTFFDFLRELKAVSSILKMRSGLNPYWSTKVFMDSNSRSTSASSILLRERDILWAVLFVSSGWRCMKRAYHPSPRVAFVIHWSSNLVCLDHYPTAINRITVHLHCTNPIN